MVDGTSRSRPRPDRARKRAIRMYAAQAGLAYSVAARQVTAAALAPGELLACHGRTVYPRHLAGLPRWSIPSRERRSGQERARDARLAAVLPSGRARHLVDRFPPGRGRAGTGAGWLYFGPGREDLLAMLYLVVGHEAPGFVPPLGDLSWTAQLAEETALDTVCAELDRLVRLTIDAGPAERWRRVETALAAASRHQDWLVRYDAERLTAIWRVAMTPREGRDGEPYVVRAPWDGVRQVLDALLVVAEDGHAPGTRIRLAAPPLPRREGTIVGARWALVGPPIGYEIVLDGSHVRRSVRPEDLVVLPDQEADGPAQRAPGPVRTGPAGQG
ncbi:hypothetical protein [Plantactinospora sp. GCM10030261]|uniref:hypothetical protein n=1 Tax=Plantactinospora sp. GCM10030261 TaxID=3273420 RepID=UPI003607E29C